MIDIETLDTRPTSVVLSIGAVEFDKVNLGATFSRNVSINSCLKLGMTVSGPTISWWNAARAMFKRQTAQVTDMLNEFVQAYNWAEFDEVWANGTDFDLAILRNAFEQAGVQCPWAYYKGRDYRTICKLIPHSMLNELRIEPTIPNNALADAIAQALTLQAVMNVGSAAWGLSLPTQKARDDIPVPTSLDQLAPKTAEGFMGQAALTLVARGREYDGVGGERSGGRIAAAFNAITGRDLSPAEVYLLLLVLKQVRQFNGKYHEDSGVDAISYAALMVEARASET